MSRIFFNSPSEPRAIVWGSERGIAKNLLTDIVLAAYQINDSPGLIDLETHPLKQILYKPSSLLKNSEGSEFNHQLATHIRIGEYSVLIDKEVFPAFDIMLNTALDIGNDQLIFLARLHGQCEIFGYVEGPNREWLADIIGYGLRANGLLRAGDNGWEEVEALLRKRNDEPVVMSYSVCYDFPHPMWAIEHGVYRYAQWIGPFEVPEDPGFGGVWDKMYLEWIESVNELSRDDDDIHANAPETFSYMAKEDQWAIAMDGLREHNKVAFMEMSPTQWHKSDFGFSGGIGAFAIRRYLDQLERLKDPKPRRKPF